jgi:hypothetical protein
VALAALWGLAGTSAEGPTFHVLAPEQARVGIPIELTVTVSNASDVGGYQARVLFDTGSAHLEGVSHANGAIAALGRYVQTLGPIEIDGGASFGVLSCATQECDAGYGKPVTSGASGDITLGTVSIVADKPGQLTIDLTGLRLASTSGADIPVTGTSQTLSVYVTDELE